MEAHKDWVNCPARLKAKQVSEKKSRQQAELKRKAHELRQKLSEAKCLWHSRRACSAWYSLNAYEQELWYAYRYGWLQKEVERADREYGHSLHTRYEGGSAHVGQFMTTMLSEQQDRRQMHSS